MLTSAGSDIIADTSRKLGLEPLVLFKNAYEDTGRVAEGNNRFERYFKYGEVSEFMIDYCLTQWRKHADEHPA